MPLSPVFFGNGYLPPTWEQPLEPRKFILVRLAMQHYRGNLVCLASCVVAKIEEKETAEEDGKGKGWKIDDDDEGASIASVRIQVDGEIPP